MGVLLFLLVWFSMLAAGFWYAGRRLSPAGRLSAAGKKTRRAILILLFALSQAHVLLLMAGHESALSDWFAWPGYVMLGALSVLVTMLAFRDAALAAYAIAHNAIARVRRRGPANAPAPPVGSVDRRAFLVRSSNLALLALTGCAGAYGFAEAQHGLAIERVRVPVRGLPGAFEGFRIAQFTDLHAGPTIKRPFIEKVASLVTSLNPDLIACTGDLADGTPAWLGRELEPLRGLAAPYGKYFVTGNHEYYSDAPAWILEAERLGFTALMNAHRVIEKQGARMVVAGVTDYGAGDFFPEQESDPEGALRGAPGGVVKLLLAHQPRSLYAAAAAGYDVQISGHTHAGQFFPWNLLVALSQPYIRGLHEFRGTRIYVSRGTGYWGPPLRLMTPPEVTLITLEPDEAGLTSAKI
ncbi:MAG: metallophosphoesterase [Spirochaetes bacterium]|nr:MAG: metallophosphoesterase [Spirochaetota bacterium]